MLSVRLLLLVLQMCCQCHCVDDVMGGCVVEHWTVGRGDQSLKPPATVSKLGQFHSSHFACVFWK